MKLSPAMPDEGIERDRTYCCAEVARIVFDWQVETFWRNRGRLHRHADFPKPISPFGHARWHGGDILDWLARPKSVDGAHSGPNVVSIDALLDKRLKAKR